ncbi:MAG: haloacid dehalogenase type II [Actinomycetota bacterium]|nr:haloacid dehalogenase type II [Actinomycetota bacterium]
MVLDVNETLSDLDGLVGLFDEVGAGAEILRAWFAATLRDGFAITAAGGYAEFADIAVPTLFSMLSRVEALRDDPQAAAERIVQAMAQLDLHPDVADGLRQIRDADIRMVTLSNGSARVAESLLERAGLRDLVERCLSVSDAGRWKPAPESYAYAADQCGVQPGEMALVAVHPWDIDGAHRAGLRTGWISRAGRSYPSFMCAPDASGRDLPELASILTGKR